MPHDDVYAELDSPHLLPELTDEQIAAVAASTASIGSGSSLDVPMLGSPSRPDGTTNAASSSGVLLTIAENSEPMETAEGPRAETNPPSPEQPAIVAAVAPEATSAATWAAIVIGTLGGISGGTIVSKEAGD